MPIYEYTCPGCGHEFEFLLRGDETPSCPQCGKTELTKNFSARRPYGQFKRSGMPGKGFLRCAPLLRSELRHGTVDVVRLLSSR